MYVGKRFVDDPSVRSRYGVTLDSPVPVPFALEKMQARLAVQNKIYDDFYAAAKENGIIWVQSAGKFGFYLNDQNRMKVVLGQGDSVPVNRGGGTVT